MKKIILSAVLLAFNTILFSQAVTQEERAQANTFFTSQDWPNVVTSYQSIAKREPQNFNARMRAGIGLLNQSKTNEAIKQLEESVALGANPMALFYLASAYAKANQSEESFDALSKSLAAGFSTLALFENDPNLASLKNQPRYNEFHTKLLQKVYPCRYTAESRLFDFWIGEWDVKNTSGNHAGKSSVQLMLGDCVIFENWTSAAPQNYSGKSFNLYNSSTKKWMQTWVDDKGSVIEFINGEYKDNKLTFVTLPNAQNQITRLTFHNLEPGRVRQHFEVTSDNGKTWTTTTDLYYQRAQ